MGSGPRARREKVVASAGRDEARQSGDGGCRARFEEAIRCGTAVISGQGTSPQPGLAQKLFTVDPICLNEFKLQVDSRVRGDEEKSSLLTVVQRVLFQERTAIADPAPQYPMAPGLTTPTDVARVGAANVSAERALFSKRVVGRVAEIVQCGLNLPINNAFLIG